MHIYSETLTRSDLDEIAAHMGIELYNADAEFSGSRRRRIRLTLRPVRGAAGEQWRLVRHGRRVWAVSWDGHYVFMRALLERDPNAEIKSSLDHWRGRDDFVNRAPESGYRNVGSQMFPEFYREAAHVSLSLGDLEDLGVMYA